MFGIDKRRNTENPYYYQNVRGRVMYNYGIVTIGYKNISGIQRLLKALDKADYQNQEILLIISIDHSGENSVLDIAEDFEWKHGKKVIKKFSQNLGLRRHVLACGYYLNEFNLDALIVFEDDMYPSIDFFRFSKAATEYYIDDDRIAGISLYTRCRGGRCGLGNNGMIL